MHRVVPLTTARSWGAIGDLGRSTGAKLPLQVHGAIVLLFFEEFVQ